MKRIVLFVLVGLIYGCADDNNTVIVIDTPPLSISFDQSEIELEENSNSSTVNISFGSAAPTAGSVLVQVNLTNAVIGEDLTINPEPIDNVITLAYDSNDDGVTFSVTALMDDDEEAEEVRFSIQSGEGISIGQIRDITLTIVDPEDMGGGGGSGETGFESCIPRYESEDLDVVTWNIRQFPEEGNLTLEAVEEIIENFDVDVIGVQEITSRSQFVALADGIDGWEAIATNVNGSIDLGYFYKTSEVEILESPTLLFGADTQPFPREVVRMKIRHSNGLEVVLMNLHLKCCSSGNGPTRRANASGKLKTYIEANLSNDEVIVLGDFNDRITGNGPFENFINDPTNYKFADQEIAEGSSSFWSFPGFPSHIDHLLITNELFDNLKSSETIRLSSCVSGYSNIVSDHRPVVASFSGD